MWHYIKEIKNSKKDPEHWYGDSGKMRPIKEKN
jgi:hypothetical protein